LDERWICKKNIPHQLIPSQDMSFIRGDLEKQLRRQSMWLKDSWLWLLETKILGPEHKTASDVTALDVGCGPGFVMEVLASVMDAKGVDIDQDMVNSCTMRGLDAVQGEGERLPFEDGSFDLVYCSFLLLWVKDPVKVLKEMKRVSRKWVVCFAEPDYGARLDYPDDLASLTQLVFKGVIKDGGDPFIGRKLRALFSECGMQAEVGIHPGIWGTDRLRIETEDEWKWVEMTADMKEDAAKFEQLKAVWIDSLEKGILFQFNPIFYAFAKK
jgi:SAM-dependent methyltransferase